MATTYPWGPLTCAAPVPSIGTNYPYTNFTGTGPLGSPNTIVWVQGELGARNHPVAPNASVLLMDTESSRFYIKSVDLMGVPTLRTYTYRGLYDTEPEVVPEKEVEALPVPTKTESKPQNESKPDYISRKEFEELKKTVDDLLS